MAAAAETHAPAAGRAAVAAHLRTARRVLIATHHNPDGDAVGSALALARLVQALGAEAHVYDKDPTPFNYRFLEEPSCRLHTALPAGRLDATCIVDVSELGRSLPADVERERLGVLLTVDHHLTSTAIGAANFIDPAAAATGLLIGELADELGLPLSRPVADCLWVALMTDTGSFRYSNTDARAMRWAARLLEVGVQPRELAERVYESMPPQRHAYLAHCLQRMEVDLAGRWAAITLRADEMERHGVTLDMIDDFINYPRSISGVEVAICYRQTGAGWKVSFRSRGAINVAAIAARFGGGGHFNAAGGFIEGRLEDARARTITAVEGETRSLAPRGAP